MKRKLLIGALFCICLSILALAGGTLAYYTGKQHTHNVITTGGIDIAVQEWADEAKTKPFPAGGVDDVMPGTAVTKIVEVKNTGNNAAYVRVSVEKSIALQGEGEPDLDLLTLDLNNVDWIDGGDGFYYYNKALAPGEVTKPLFTTVSFHAGMNNLYQNSKAAVDVAAYAVQVANNGDTPLEADGWPEAE